ncbi:MAG: NUDIX domain-containing protein [Chitinophagaceae bacterium]
MKQARLLAAVDCIIFGFDGESLKILLIHRGFEPERDKWSLMGGFIQPDESADAASVRILKSLTGLEGVYWNSFILFLNLNEILLRELFPLFILPL